MNKIPLYTNDGRVVAHLDTDTLIVYKKVKAKSHMLRKPPAWTYDVAIIDQVRSQVDDLDKVQFIIEAVDSRKIYRLAGNEFNKVAYKMKWRQNANYEQWVALLPYWSIEEKEDVNGKS